MRRFMQGVVLAIGLSAGLMGQAASVVRSGSYEVGGFLGASYGIDEFRWMGGANLTYAATKRILPYAEFTYLPGILRKQTINNPAFTQPLVREYNIPLTDFHGGVHIRFPLKESPVVPYGVFGVGVIHAPARNLAINASGIQFNFQQPATNDLAVNFGGGIRYYISQRYGIRAEAKMYKPTGQFTDAFGKVEFGFFLQLK